MISFAISVVHVLRSEMFLKMHYTLHSCCTSSILFWDMRGGQELGEKGGGVTEPTLSDNNLQCGGECFQIIVFTLSSVSTKLSMHSLQNV